MLPVGINYCGSCNLQSPFKRLYCCLYICIICGLYALHNPFCGKVQLWYCFYSYNPQNPFEKEFVLWCCLYEFIIMVHPTFKVLLKSSLRADVAYTLVFSVVYMIFIILFAGSFNSDSAWYSYNPQNPF